MFVFEKARHIGSLPALAGNPSVFGTEDPSIESLDRAEYVIFPGFCDVHVHFREPGFSYKETIGSGCRAAARGGYTAVCTMPNVDPVPDSMVHLLPQTERIMSDACINVYPFGAVTVGEKGEALSRMEELAPYVCGFSDDGKGVQSGDMMRAAMLECRRLGKVLSAHCEDNSLLRGGYIHSGVYCALHGHKGICSESEWGPIARDIALAKETGCAYHVCHISTKESVALIRQAKAEGVDITCETAPHYLLLDDSDLQEDGRFKMNPPLRSREDREALLVGLLDGTIDMIATDHAPHSAEEKSKGLVGSAFGIVGLETAFPLLYTGLVRPGILSLERLVELLTTAPRQRFGLPHANSFSLWDLDARCAVDPAEFLSMGRATPFEGREVFGKCLLTVMGGRVVWRAEDETRS